MSNYDASIRINTKINTDSAEVQLERLENRILKTSDKVVSLRSKMDSLKDTEIPTQEYQDLQKELNAATKELDRMVAQDSRLADINKKIKNLSQSSEEYAAKMKEVAERQIPTEAYASVQKQITETEKKLISLQQKQDKFLATGGKDSSSAYKKTAYDIEQLEKKLERLNRSSEFFKNKGTAFSPGTDTDEYKNLSAKYESVNKELEKQKSLHSEIAQKQADSVQKTIELKAQMARLVEEGKAFTLGQDTEEYAKLGQQLGYAENELSTLNKQHGVLEKKLQKAQGGYKSLGDTAKASLEKINDSQKKSIGLLGSFGKQLKSILLATFIFNTIRKAFNALIAGIKEGFTNLYEGNERFKNSVDSLKASALTLKNSLAAAFAPLVEIAIPYIQRFIEWLTRAVNLIGQFIAALTGRKTYTRAIKQTAQASDDAAEATEKEAEATEEAEEAAEKYLSPLDKLNRYQEDKTKDSKNPTSKDDKTPDDGGTGTMFEEVPIDNRILDFLQKLKDFLEPVIDYAEKLKDIFVQGFWDGLGDWEYRWESIKDSIASIKDSLIDIFTDPAVLASTDKWAQSVAYMLGSLAGSMASIGLTLATNLLGGLALYLDQNKDRIKGYLISMFDIWSEVNYLFADLFQSIAYVFEAFASKQGQQLTANIIGIFVDAFMGITELASKFFRDLSQIIIKPFVDNKEAFRVALEGFLGVLAEVTGTIKQGIDDTFAKLNEVYDAHFKPFFDSVALGLSDLVAKFMEFWNGNVQPILDQMAADFDVLWKSHIQPFLDNVAELLGKVADLLKALWENILQPLIAWIIENILPKILPVIQTIWDTLVDFLAYFVDLINSVITILGGVIDFLTGVFTGDWELAFQGLEDILNGFIDFILKSIEGAIDLVLDIVKAFWEATRASFEAFVDAMLDGIEAFLDWIKKNVINKSTEITKEFEKFLSGVKEKWDKGWNALKNKVSSIIESVKSTIQSAFDWIAEKVNAIAEKLSSIGDKAKSIFGFGSGGIFGSGGLFGGSSFSVSTASYSLYPPEIMSLASIDPPGYATGQVIPRTMKQHLAILGDNSRETEVVSPLSTIKQALKEAMLEMGGTGRSDQPIILKLILDGKQVLYAMVKEGKIEQMSSGNNIFLLEE